MIWPKKSNNVESKQLNYLSSDKKSQIKAKNYLDFLLFNVKYLGNYVKMTIIWLWKGICFAFKTNLLAWFDEIWVPNTKTIVQFFWVFFQLNNLPKLTKISNLVWRHLCLVPYVILFIFSFFYRSGKMESATLSFVQRQAVTFFSNVLETSIEFRY